MPKITPPPEFEDRGFATPCLIWQGRPSVQGYGRTTTDGVTRPAHVVAWERVYGPVPDDHEVDHLCYVRMCVNVDHLECVSRAENRRRAALRRHNSYTPAQRSEFGRQRWVTRRAKERVHG